VRSGYSDTFRLFHQAILNKKQIVCTYRGKRREVCPIILGHKDGVEKALVYQFGGESSRGLSRRGDWKCFEIANVFDAETRDGPWHAESRHRATQRGVDDVYVDVNLAVPNQPGRRGL
jgi:predicted DNA-binding transcriptional regulator YafY